MQRKLSVTRIFPLGQYKNIQLTNETIFGEQELNPEVDTKELYDEMIYEIYATFYQHAKEAMAFESGKSLDDKWEAYNTARNEALKIREEK